jgi:ABC-type transporter Mla MlaB component
MLESVAANHYRLRGQIDMQADTSLLHELMCLPQSVKRDQLGVVSSVELDVSQLESADSLLLAALLDLQRKFALQNVNLSVTGLSESMLGLARVYGVDGLFKKYIKK